MAATDLEKLVVQLSADFKQFERQMARAQGVTNKQFTAIERRARQLNRNLDGIFARMGRSLVAPLAGFGAALGARELLRMADTWTELKSRVDLASESMEAGEQVMGRLSEMARRTYSGLEQTAESWLSNATALRELGYSTQQQLDLVETLNNALVISAAKGQRAASVMDAWSKAMALGKLSGQNLNTIIQSGGRLAEALAASMGVGTNELRALGQAGKITTREMYGVTSQLAKLRDEADSMQATIGDAIQLLKDAMLQYVGGADQAAGASAKLAEAIIFAADNFDTAANAALQLAFVLSGALAGRALVAAGANVVALTTSIAAMTTAMRAGTLTAAGFTAALGPIGLIAGAAAAALYLLSDRTTDAELAADKHKVAVRLLTQEIDNLDYANQDAVASTRTKITSDIEAARAALQRAKAERELAASIAASNAGDDPMSRARLESFGVSPEQVDANVRGSVDDDPLVQDREVLIDKLNEQLEDLKKVNADFEDYASGRKKPPRPEPAVLPSASDASGKKATKERADEYERLAQRIADSTAALVQETELQRQLNPLVEDYGYALEKARAEMQLLNAAKEAGVKVTPELRAQIEALAEQYALATVEAAKLAEEQDKAREAAEAWERSVEHLFTEAGNALVSVIDGSEKAADAVKKLVIQLMLAAAQAALLGSGPLAGFIPSIFRADGGAVEAASGGYIRGPGGPRDDKIPARLSNGEYVINARQTAKHRALLDAINQGKVPAMRDGGPVGIVAPRIPSLAGMRSAAARRLGNTNFTMHVTVSGTGDKELMERMQKGAEVQMQEAMRQFSQEVMPARVSQIIHDPDARG